MNNPVQEILWVDSIDCEKLAVRNLVLFKVEIVLPNEKNINIYPIKKYDIT